MNSRTLLFSTGALLSVAAMAAATGPEVHGSHGAPRFLIQAADLDTARLDVASAGAPVEEDLAIVNGVSAHLYPWQAVKLRAMPGVHVFADRALRSSGLVSGLLNGMAATATSTVGALASRGSRITIP